VLPGSRLPPGRVNISGPQCKRKQWEGVCAEMAWLVRSESAVVRLKLVRCRKNIAYERL